MQDATINNYTYTKLSVKLTLKDHKGNKIDLTATTEVEKLTRTTDCETRDLGIVMCGSGLKELVRGTSTGC